MSYVNYDDVIRQLKQAGLILDRELALDARIQRWLVEDEGRERRGWSRLKEWLSPRGGLYIVGAYGAWHGTDDGYTRIEISRDGVGRELSDEDRASIRAANKEAAKRLAEERKREAKIAGGWAAVVWNGADPVVEHEYLARKGIKAHGVRVLTSLDRIVLPDLDESNRYRLEQSIGALVVPMHDPHGNVCGIQLIYPKGHPRKKKIERDKDSWPAGMAMAGTFGVIGPIHRTGILLVCEGYATGASLHEATRQSVAYAFAANNLVKAGKLLRKQYPRLRLLFCADDDYLTPENPGISAAAQATAEIENTGWLAPDFRDANGNDQRAGRKLTDFNDLAALTGLPLVLADQVNAKLDELGWREKVSGAATFSGGAGPEESGRRRARSVMPLDELIERFMPLDDGTGKHVFDGWTNKVVHKDQMISLLPPGLRVDDIKRHPIWAQRGAYFMDQVGFDPAGSDGSVLLNTWRGWPMAPAQGKCQCLLDLIEYLCGGEAKGARDLFQWLIRWMAYPLQHPGAKMASAVIMHGPQGTGKSTVFQVLAKIYGDYATVLNQRGLEDRFNADWADSKLFILAEEVVTRAEMWHIKNELKELVTGEWVRINPKNIGAYRQRNHVNIAYLSNENQPLPIENDDRRHCVIWTPPELPEAFYDELFIEIDNGGVAAFYHYLLGVDLSSFHPKKRPPMTEAKKALIDLSLPSEVRFAQEWIAGDTLWPVMPCLAADLYSAYLRWCRVNGESRPRPSNQFFGVIGRLSGWQKKRQRIYEGTAVAEARAKPMVFPPESAMEKNGHSRPPAMDEVRWLSSCASNFASAMAELKVVTG